MLGGKKKKAAEEDRLARLKQLATIEEGDYAGFRALVQAAHNRRKVFPADMAVWRVAKKMRFIQDCNDSGVPEMTEDQRDFLKDTRNIVGGYDHPSVVGAS